MDWQTKKKVEEARRIFRKHVKSHDPDLEYLMDVVRASEEEGTPIEQLIEENVEDWKEEGTL